MPTKKSKNNKNLDWEEITRDSDEDEAPQTSKSRIIRNTVAPAPTLPTAEVKKLFQNLQQIEAQKLRMHQESLPSDYMTETKAKTEPGVGSGMLHRIGNNFRPDAGSLGRGRGRGKSGPPPRRAVRLPTTRRPVASLIAHSSRKPNASAPSQNLFARFGAPKPVAERSRAISAKSPFSNLATANDVFHAVVAQKSANPGGWIPSSPATHNSTNVNYLNSVHSGTSASICAPQAANIAENVITSAGYANLSPQKYESTKKGGIPTRGYETLSSQPYLTVEQNKQRQSWLENEKKRVEEMRAEVEGKERAWESEKCVADIKMLALMKELTIWKSKEKEWIKTEREYKNRIEEMARLIGKQQPTLTVNGHSPSNQTTRRSYAETATSPSDTSPRRPSEEDSSNDQQKTISSSPIMLDWNPPNSKMSNRGKLEFRCKIPADNNTYDMLCVCVNDDLDAFARQYCLYRKLVDPKTLDDLTAHIKATRTTTRASKASRPN